MHHVLMLYVEVVASKRCIVGVDKGGGNAKSKEGKGKRCGLVSLLQRESVCVCVRIVS